MKKAMMRVATACIVLMGTGFLVTGCSHLSVANGDQKDLVELRRVATSVNSAIWASYVGETSSAIYVEYGTMAHPAGVITNKPKYTVYRFDKDEMTPEMKEMIWWKESKKRK